MQNNTTVTTTAAASSTKREQKWNSAMRAALAAEGARLHSLRSPAMLARLRNTATINPATSAMGLYNWAASVRASGRI